MRCPSREETITSVELTEAFLARSEARRDLNAYLTLDRAGALAAAGSWRARQITLATSLS